MKALVIAAAAFLAVGPALACDSGSDCLPDPLLELQMQDQQKQINALQEQVRQAQRQREDAEMRADFWELDPGGPPN